MCQATGVLVALAFGGGLSLGLLVGFVTIFGVTLRNSLLMISHYDDLILVERMTWGVEAAVRGATERLARDFDEALVYGNRQRGARA